MDSVGGGKLTFHSTTPSTNNSYSTSTIINVGELKIVSGTVENTTTGGASYAIDNAWYTKDVTLSIEGGVVTAQKIAVRQVLFSATARNTITISGGVIDGGYAGLQIHNYSTSACLSDVTITGGTFNGDYAFYTYYGYNNTATGTNIAINGGEFNGYVYLYNGIAGSDAYPMTVSVTGGTFNSGYYAYCKDSTGANVAIPSITGGTYIYDATDYCVEGYGMYANGDGTYSVAERTAAFAGDPQSVTAKVGETVQFTVQTTGDIIAYRWEYSRDGITWYNTKMEGVNTNTLTVPVLLSRDGYQYRCVVTDAYGNGATSAPATLTVEQPAEFVQITQQPAAQTAFAGESAIFAVEATGDGLTYQWQYSKNGANWYYTGMTGAKTAQLTVDATLARDGYQYRCVITDAYGTTVTTDAAALAVNEKTIATAGPEDQIVTGGTAIFTVNVEGDGLTYRWQYQRADGTKWFDTTMEGYNTNTLSVVVTAARNGYKYRCIITDAYGNETVSDEAALIIAQSLVITGPQDQEGKYGEATFTVTVEGAVKSYKWQYSKNGTTWSDVTSESAAGFDTAVLRVAATDKRNGYQYRCVITDMLGVEFITDAATLTVN